MYRESLVTRAAAVAMAAHGAQVRIRGYPFPHIIHAYNVAQRIALWCQRERRTDAEQAVAIALLHDVAEDSTITLGQLADMFGSGIGESLEWLTDPPALRELPLRERKRAQARRFARCSNTLAVAVKVADQADHVAQIASLPSPTRSAGDCRAYCIAASLVVDALRRHKAVEWLITDFDAVFAVAADRYAIGSTPTRPARAATVLCTAPSAGA